MTKQIRIFLVIMALAAGLVGWSAMHTTGASEQAPTARASSLLAEDHPRTSTIAVAAAPVQATAPDDVLSPPNQPDLVAPKFAPYSAYIYIPQSANTHQPLQVVVALHGMGGEGKSFGGLIVKEAERYGWLLVAPTIAYGDWRNPDVVAKEEIEISQRLLATIDQLPQTTGLAVKPLVHVFGFSRGAQLAHRFALFFPERVDAVAAFSAGTYTLPDRVKDLDGDGVPERLVFPYGVADLSQRLGHPLNPARLRGVRFFVGVGAADNSANDVPRQWDDYLGRTRVERAREFASVLQGDGIACTFQLFPGVGHEITQAELNQLPLFFAGPAVPTITRVQ